MDRNGKRGRAQFDLIYSPYPKRLQRPLPPPEEVGREGAMDRWGKCDRPQADHFPASPSEDLPPPLETLETRLADSLPSPSVVVADLPPNCCLHELKTRLEMYGPISRFQVDFDRRVHVTFRSDLSAEALIAVSVDPAVGFLICSRKVLVVRGSDPLPDGYRCSLTSELVRAKPLRTYGPSRRKLDDWLRLYATH